MKTPTCFLLLGLLLATAPASAQPAPAPATGGGQPAVAGGDEVGQELTVLVVDRGALGHRDHEVGAAVAVLLLALAVGAVGGPAVRVVAEGQQ